MRKRAYRNGRSSDEYAVIFQLANEVFADEANVVRGDDVCEISNRLEAAAVCIRNANEEVDDPSLIFREKLFRG